MIGAILSWRWWLLPYLSECAYYYEVDRKISQVRCGQVDAHHGIHLSAPTLPHDTCAGVAQDAFYPLA